MVMTPEYYDEAIVGVVVRMGLEAVCYDESKIIDILMKHDKMEYDEAVEHMEFNMKGSWVGEFTPVFLSC